MRKKDPKYKKIDLINKIVEMSCSGISQPQILIWLQTEGECSISFCYDLLREAKPIILDVLKDLSKDRLETTIRELEQMKVETGDKKLKLDIQKEINKISGLYLEKVDVTSAGKELTEVKVVIVNGDKGDAGS